MSPGGRKTRASEGLNGEESETPMNLEEARRQKPAQAGPPSPIPGEARMDRRGGEALTAEHGNGSSGSDCLMEQVVERDNMRAALRRVKGNKGSPGIDGMTVDELSTYLKKAWPGIREQLLAGTYEPKPVLRREIPKNGGGMRMLGIPTALDRLIQQAVLQVLQPRFDPGFSEHSYGFRPGRRAHDAVRAAQKYIQAGGRFVVDVDLEKFFDRVNHDVLMGRLAKRIEDKRMLRLIRCFLNAGILADGVVLQRHEGTPQGGPVSPLLANVLLDEVDKELEKRGYAFARYADDCNVYVGSRRAGERVMNLLRRMYAKLRLRINESKSAVARTKDRKFLGYTFWVARAGEVRLRVAPKAMDAMKDRVRKITARSGGRSIQTVARDLRTYLIGWKQYFRLSQTPRVFEQLDGWIRRRLRTLQLKQWKWGSTIYRELRKLGVSEMWSRLAASQGHRLVRSAHKQAQVVLPNSHFDRLGVPRLAS
jgi:RNA-directed DNA polymerase